MYSLNYIIGNKALMVLRLKSDEMERTKIAELLCENEIVMVTQSDINKL